MKIGKIIVIGGGIGGLAASLALQRSGFDVVVYERASELREIGAGVMVTANARRGLADLGVDNALAAISSCVPTMHHCDYATGEIIRDVSNEDLARKHGFATLQVHRGDLHRVLLDAVRTHSPTAVRPAHDFVSLEQDDTTVSVSFANQSQDSGDAVIGADGNASSVRSFLVPGQDAEFNGQVAYRALIPANLVPPRALHLQHAMHRAPRRYLMHYPLRGGTVTNLIGCGQAAGWEEEGWSIPATNDEFERSYDDFAPHLIEMIRSIPEGGLFKWGLRDRDPMKSWVYGRVAMLGDAAHPMTPFLGQGACLAIEDAVVLGRAFKASSSIEEALKRYERARKERGTNVQLWSREEGLALQDTSRPRQNAADRNLHNYDPTTAKV